MESVHCHTMSVSYIIIHVVLTRSFELNHDCFQYIGDDPLATSVGGGENRLFVKLKVIDLKPN